MVKQIVIILLSAVLGMLTSGCLSTVTAEFDKPIVLMKNPYDVPVKFYVDRLEFDTTDYMGYTRCISDLKDKFHQYYPELFSDNHMEALPIGFKISIDSVRNGDLGDALFGAISAFSIGLVPGPWKLAYEFEIVAETVDMRTQETFKIRHCENIGWFGLHALFPHFSDPIFTTVSAAMPFSNNLTIKSGKEPEIMRLFINQLYQLPRDKVQEIYLSKFGEKVEFLE